MVIIALPLVLYDVVEQLSARSIFGDEVEMSRILYDLIQLYDVGMPDQLQNLYFPRDSFNVVVIDYLLFLEDLDGDSFLGRQMDAQLDLSEGAFTQLLAWLEPSLLRP